MRALLFTALVAVSSTASVVAQEIVEFEDHFVSRLTRAEVIQDLGRARSHGEMVTAGEISAFADDEARAPRDVAAVRAEAGEAARSVAAGTVYSAENRN
ncbi:DUF4148 domain-containing protein [Burkholderiaceae bacterium FT117]|uniref:DUF4148 domain-containing protein n=1 Tax=Zeimonas sediminis TaxID=2944268 RepID=UPI002342E7D0|nr:DUF4148 domain-containing protein [Zeimonas sediminis]MCM5568894.1 DUF4148 domain-containing protein [Zeimonas sediminis]